MKVAAIASPTAFVVPIVCLFVTKISFAICMKDERDDMFAVFAIILKKTISKGVITMAITADEAAVASIILIKRCFCP